MPISRWGLVDVDESLLVLAAILCSTCSQGRNNTAIREVVGGAVTGNLTRNVMGSPCAPPAATERCVLNKRSLSPVARIEKFRIVQNFGIGRIRPEMKNTEYTVQKHGG